ncbi:MAG: hypothetical protein KME30_32610 [Iphinoe sp. HA4291-MV1]|jgi:uncharacterized membrane protein|nr:hypothetical protein [Iphinoe sp. HA4291-MV1]
MTQDQPSRLDQIESALDRQVRATSEALLGTVQIHQRNFEAVVARFDAMQSEIRGLQTENRRILNRLKGLETMRQAPDERSPKG